MATTIIDNGGGSVLPIETLFERLAENTLCRSFLSLDEGNYVFMSRMSNKPGVRQFWGNFADYSHVFRIESDDRALCLRLATAIRDNLRRHRAEDPATAPCPGGHRARWERQREERLQKQIKANGWSRYIG